MSNCLYYFYPNWKDFAYRVCFWPFGLFSLTRFTLCMVKKEEIDSDYCSNFPHSLVMDTNRTPLLLAFSLADYLVFHGCILRWVSIPPKLQPSNPPSLLLGDISDGALRAFGGEASNKVIALRFPLAKLTSARKFIGQPLSRII